MQRGRTSGDEGIMSDTISTTAAPADDLFAVKEAGASARGFAWSAKARPLRGVHGWLRGVLFLYIAAHAATALIVVGLLWAFATLSSGAGIDETTATMLVTLGGLAQLAPFAVIGIFVACIIGYLLFVYRAMKNLHVSNARGLTTSPGWAVGWSFIPFANLAMIYSVMKQIWRASADPERGRRDAPQLLGWWWGLWIAGNISGNISERLTPSETAIEVLDVTELLSAFTPGILMGVVSAALTITSTFFLLIIVRQITASQETLRSTAAFDE
jgi:hypothetical protein